MRILFVEDEPQLAEEVSQALTRAGHEVTRLAGGADFLTDAHLGGADLILVDSPPPPADGLPIVRKVHALRSRSRVLLLTRGDANDRVAALRAGADDCLTKPFLMDELLARIDSLGRRAATPIAGTLLEAGDLRMDLAHRKVTFGGRTVPLSPREFEVLQVFMEEPGRTFTREELCERIWARPHEYDTRTVEIFVMRLRKKLAGGKAPVIETIRGAGYALRPQRATAAASPPA